MQTKFISLLVGIITLCGSGCVSQVEYDRQVQRAEAAEDEVRQLESMLRQSEARAIAAEELAKTNSGVYWRYAAFGAIVVAGIAVVVLSNAYGKLSMSERELGKRDLILRRRTD